MIIDNVVILCLDKRRTLWEELEKSCLQRGWDVHKFIVGDGLDNLPYDYIDSPQVSPQWSYASGISALRHYNAFQSHRKIIARALKNNWSNFLLLEDDAIILSRFTDILSKTNPVSFDLIQFGWWAFEMVDHKHSGLNIQIEEDYSKTGNISLIKMAQCGGFHGVLINQSAYTKLLSFPPVAPMDYQVNLNIASFERMISIPKGIHVRSCFSYCENTFVERDMLE